MDMENREHVCVVGSYIDDVWFGGSAVGGTIRIGGTDFTVVGVLEQEADEEEEGGEDDVIFLPYSTAARLSGTAVSSYTVTIVSEDEASQAKAAMEQALYEVFRSEDAYTVISMTQILDMMTQMIGVLITILAVIAGISLVVGGIGIMNIMLVSVSERTREIGIRKALGAKERYILTQFVIEAAVVSAIGGLIGIAAGFGAVVPCHRHHHGDARCGNHSHSVLRLHPAGLRRVGGNRHCIRFSARPKGGPAQPH